MIVLENVCFHCRMVLVFHQDFLRFCGRSLGCKLYLRLLGDVLHWGQILFFQWSCRNLDRIQQVLCFVEWFFVFTCKFCFVIYLKMCQFIFYIMDVSKFSTSSLSWVYFFKWD